MGVGAGPVVLVLASGRGARFLASGGATHKLQARLGGATVLEHTLAAVQASGLAWHLEQGGQPGMGDSIAAAVRATAHASGWLILPADLPLVSPATLCAVAAALRTHATARPVYKGKLGHPVGFAEPCGSALRELRGERGAASVLQVTPATLVEVNDVGCVLDIDTVQDLAQAQQILQEMKGG